QSAMERGLKVNLWLRGFTFQILRGLVNKIWRATGLKALKSSIDTGLFRVKGNLGANGVHQTLATVRACRHLGGIDSSSKHFYLRSRHFISEGVSTNFITCARKAHTAGEISCVCCASHHP